MATKSNQNTALVDAATNSSSSSCSFATTTSHLKILKARQALRLARKKPEKWFRDTDIEQRDRDLLSAPPVKWLAYDQSSFVRKIYHCKQNENFKMTDWIVETDTECKKMIATAGGRMIGIVFDTSVSVPWLSMKVNVHITGTSSAPFDWGFLSTKPSSIRVFKGPAETCPNHPWDAMILRDCTWSTDTLGCIEFIASRKWDILVMKMCEDFNSPWAVVAIKDAGEFVPDLNASCYAL